MSILQDWKTEPIAIVGSSCRLPGGANSPSKLWELLKHPVDLLAEIPSNRFNPSGFYHENPEHHRGTNVKHAYLLDGDPRVFDNEFFNIHVKEAESMDPQQRILLETVYESIESAGYSMLDLKGSLTGVFVGQMSDDYRDMLFRDVESHPRYIATGTSRAIVANRVSYFFDWRGPSVNIDTACSSSLVALHQGVQSLRNGESAMAVVAGVNLILGPELFIFESSLRMLSPEGRSRMWDSRANGYARGEGFATILIKTLKQALADNDSIECIIRETGVNHDGHTVGLTVPSATSQAALIESTYAKCGLNCQSEEDRCQYFEAHGTGTPVGDPKEAQAIHTAFFQERAGFDNHMHEADHGRKLYVGSIKTVVGHLEGAAGLAGLLKASLAVQYGVIPPNMLFEQLNPDIEPFYKHLEVPTTMKLWPKLSPGVPRRASINSFGFGGANAHAIIESWEGPSPNTESRATLPHCGPFTLSANSEAALAASIISLSAALKTQDNPDLFRLSWTLQRRRTPLRFRISFSACSKAQLTEKLDSAIQQTDLFPIATKAIFIPRSRHTRLLGIFTGQGAQWPGMGAGLYLKSACFRNTIQQLEETLKNIPDGPSWSLSEELLASVDSSRISLAEYSQPLCTAVQIALVDLLRECGIHFSAVVGHSSGEIAAAYAAGVLGASEAILVAYYRGYHCRLSQSVGVGPGKMMAAGMTWEDAEALCRRPQFLGRITPAASNSSSSVTLSGDAGAIDEAKEALDNKGTLARILRVDKAYHSHHMECVRDSYLASLRQCNVRSRDVCSPAGCNWYSSVFDGKVIHDPSDFEDTYWAENMVRPVLFSQAVSKAIEEDQSDLALEVGPHPALQGPASEVLRAVRGTSIPYYGVLRRNECGFEAYSSALGFVWMNIDSSVPPVNFAGFHKACNPDSLEFPHIVKYLPPYPWDHDKPMLKESRRSLNWRTRSDPIRELLGIPTWSCNHDEVRWRNVLRLSEIEWLNGHQFQNQVLFPSAGYLSMALDAALHIVGDQQAVHLVELQDVLIYHAITLAEGSGVDIEFVIRLVRDNPQRKVVEYACYCSNLDSASPQDDKKVFTGRALVILGAPDRDALPARVAPSLPMSTVSIDRFYSWMRNVGLQYSGQFLLESMKRRTDFSSVTTARIPTKEYMMHPGTLDSVLQSLFAAFSYPGDGRLWSPYLPTSFRQVRINMATCSCAVNDQDSELVADGHITESSASGFCGDISVFCVNDSHPEIQIQGISLSSLEVPSAANDRNIFARTIWAIDISSSIMADRALINSSASANGHTRELYEVCERTAYFYLRQLCQEVPRHEIPSLKWHFQCLMHWALDCVLPAVQSNSHPHLSALWNGDTHESIARLKNTTCDSQVDLELIHKLGPRLPSIVRGSVPTLQVLMEDEKLKELYQQGFGCLEANAYLGAVVSQLVHRYPRMQVIEIGAGTGGATASALRHLGTNLQGYTFTDISAGFFEEAQAMFAEYSSTMSYRVLDIEHSPIEQGFEPHSFDLIIASNVLHATRTLSRTLQHCRQLLRPGGYLILLELTSDALRIRFLVSGLPGWWLGRDDGRTQGPTITEAQWNSVLEDCQFSGVDHVVRDFEDDSMHTYSVMLSQAVDDRINFLRDPLNPQVDSLGVGLTRIPKVLLIGGHTLRVSKIARKVEQILAPFARVITIVNCLEEFRSGLESGCSVICLSDLEQQVFRSMTQERLSAIQHVFNAAKYILWATRGRCADKPHANMIVGMGRSIARERPDLRLKFLDFDRPQKLEAEAVTLSETLLQMLVLDLPEYDGILWSNETEIAIKDGESYIPRVIPDQELNNRFNATRRKLTQSVSPLVNPVEVVQIGGGIVLEQAKHTGQVKCPNNALDIRVLTSSLHRFTIPGHHHPLYFCLGISMNTKKHVFAISEYNGSMVRVPLDDTFEFSFEVGELNECLLGAVLATLLCESLMGSATGSIWIHNVDNYVFEVISKRADAQGTAVFITTDDRTSNLVSSGKAIYIHPRSTQRELRHLIPHEVEHLYNMGSVMTDEFQDLVASCLDHNVNIQHVSRGIDVKQTVPLCYSKSELHEFLKSYTSQPGMIEIPDHVDLVTVVKADAVHEIPRLSSPAIVLDWVGVGSVSVPVVPAVKRTRFSGHKTYFLVGLTGDVGLSLCEWMVDCGAKHLAISSRNPNIAPEMLLHFERMGAIVRVFSLDVSDKENLLKVHQEIVSSMPPIAGIASGALVLRDKPFDSLSLSDFEMVLGPRVTGSQNLDDLFFSTPLEFFILLSSSSCIIGNPSQSNYNASNMFMSALVAQRRQRGLAASVLDIGMLVGLGNLHNNPTAGSKVEAHFRKEGFNALSAHDLHIMFAEAINSGSPEFGLDPELVTGLGNHIDTDWSNIPRLWHYSIQERTSDMSLAHGKARGTQNVQGQLEEASDADHALSIVEVAFAEKLGLLLGSSAMSLDRNASLVTMGIDSLVAVEIRSWFLKVLKVDVPVLKVLGGESLMGICRDVLAKLPTSLKPWEADQDMSLSDDTSESPITNTPGSPPENLLWSPAPAIEVHAVGLIPEVSLEVHRLPDTILDSPQRKLSSKIVYERVGDVSHAQAQLYFLHEYLENKSAYNVAYYGDFHGCLDISRFQEAICAIGKRHESLRSAYFLDRSTDRPIQAVLPEPRIIFEHKRIHGDSEIQQATEDIKDFVFDIEHGVVLKVTILSQSLSLHHILFSHHHIALDGVSWGVFIADLSRAYLGNNDFPLVQQPIDVAKRLSARSSETHSDLAFWETMYQSPPEPLSLFPFAMVKTRQNLKKYINDSTDVKLGSNLSSLVTQASRKLGITSFHFYLASFAAFLSRCLGMSDVVIGVVDANRTKAEDSGTIGYFLNMLPLRIRLESDESFESVARRSRDIALAGLGHSQTPFDMVLDHLSIPRSTNSSHPLFQVAVNYQKGLSTQTEFGDGAKIEWLGGIPAGNPYDLLVNIHETPESTLLSFVTQTYLYDKADVGLMLRWFQASIEGLAEEPSIEIGRFPLCKEEDIRNAVELGRGSGMEVPWTGTLICRIDTVAEQHPECVAIKDDNGQVLTYAQMKKRTCQIARQLQRTSASPGSFVAMLLDPIPDAVCCILAIMRSDLVWIPLDTRNHHGRLRSIVAESKPYLLVCNSATEEQAYQLASGATPVMNIDDVNDDEVPVNDGVAVEDLSETDHPAAVIYTSGSTGVPKGVILTHEGLVNQIYGSIITLGLGREVTLQQSPLGFDLMLDQVFLALSNGGTIIMVGKEGRGDPMHIAELMVSQNVSLTHFVPSEYYTLLNYGLHILRKGESWRYAMSGGERMGPELRRAFRKLNSGNVQLVNVYGPAEITIACARGIAPYRTEEDVLSSIDWLRTSPNYRIEIMDASLNVLPVGFAGEICISGPGVGLGYLNRPEETQRKFLTRGPELSTRTYRSGDFGRLLPNGTLKVLGRLDGDSQVKIRGHRVELDEIANSIIQVSAGAVVNAAASLRAADVLAAFIVFDAEFAGDKAEFAEELKSKLPLPLYMRPDFIIPTGRIPATSNGKTDRRAVDELAIFAAASQDDSAQVVDTEDLSPIEESIKNIWEEVLASRMVTSRKRTIGSSSDFFQVGGNSLLLIKLRSILRSTFGITLSLPELFQASILSSMADRVAASGGQENTSAKMSVKQIDWDVEIATLADGLSKAQLRNCLDPTITSPQLADQGLTVVLTGATGFIGRHILQHLVDDPRIQQVHCIAIRPSDSGEPRHVAIKGPKVVEYTGNLSDLSLGLSDSEFKSLSQTVDAIIHNGAEVSLMKTYQSLRRPNVISTRTLCELGLPRRVPVHFISTASVAKVVDADILYEVSAAFGTPRLGDIDGYAASKWAGEVLLEKVSMDQGLPTWVHRLAHVVGDDASELDAVGMLFKYSLLLRKLPSIDPVHVKGKWDFVKVDDVALDLVRSVVDSVHSKSHDDVQQQLETHFVHHCDDAKVPHEEFKRYLEDIAKAPLQEVDMGKWLKAALEKGLSPLVHDFLAGFIEGGKSLVLPLIARGALY